MCAKNATPPPASGCLIAQPPDSTWKRVSQRPFVSAPGGAATLISTRSRVGSSWTTEDPRPVAAAIEDAIARRAGAFGLRRSA